MDKSGSEFLDMANDILEGEGMIDSNTGKLTKFKGNQISLAKQLVSKEYIAVVIYKGTKEEIKVMSKNG